MTLAELADCLRILLTAAKDWGSAEVVPEDRDLYWTMDSADWRDVYREPKLLVGSLDDDAAALRKLLEDPTRATPLDLERAAHLLLVVAERKVG